MSRFLNDGAFADVFDLGDGSVAKVYRRTSHTHGPVLDWDDHDFITRRLYDVEVNAYERLQAFPELLRYLPHYYGPIDHAALNLQPSNPDERFVAGCAFRLERIQGQAIKVALVEDDLREGIEGALEKIRDVSGRVNVWDCSCFIPGPRSEFVVIDFALWKDLPSVGHYLDKNKCLPEEMRKFLSLG